ncbi:BAT2 domain protein [Quillaja saponaria]|uniref:BAT2 domain protein n=1 Tax=Quillaja saponaria TaxID=32244 RepID=A0AAD7PT90_QUISA|nr:BAT2 domain protein [Quillaja saponaria]
MFGKSIISNAKEVQDGDADQDTVNIDWPEDSVEKGKIIRANTPSMTGYVEAVSNSFIAGTGIILFD